VAYQLLQKSGVAKEVAGLDRSVRSRVDAAIADLAADPRPPGYKKLRGKGSSRYRISVAKDYRVVYEVDDKAQTVTVLAVGHRREVYR
jgi:mRNA interferase RelE/StbE